MVIISCLFLGSYLSVRLYNIYYVTAYLHICKPSCTYILNKKYTLNIIIKHTLTKKVFTVHLLHT